MAHRSRRGVNRRTFLAGAGSVGAASIVGVNPLRAAAASSRQGPPAKTYGLFVFGTDIDANGVLARTSPYADGGNPLFPWLSFEPSPGVYNWSTLDSRLAAYEAVCRTMILRVTTNLTSFRQDTPDWLFDEFGARFYYNSAATEAKGYRDPVPWDPIYREHFGAFVRALGERYNRHPAIEFIQTTGVGPYGEIGMFPNAYRPEDWTEARNNESVRWQAGLWNEAFPDTHKSVMMNGYTYLKSAVDHAVYDLGYYAQMNNYMYNPGTRAWMTEYSPHTRLVVEAENGGRTSTLDEGFAEIMDVAFSFDYGIDYMTLNAETFADDATAAALPELVIERLRKRNWK